MYNVEDQAHVNKNKEREIKKNMWRASESSRERMSIFFLFHHVQENENWSAQWNRVVEARSVNNLNG